MNSNKHHKWLVSQIPHWVKDGVIGDQQAAALLARYPVSEGMGLGRMLISGAGAIMIGLGIILLFAYNWAEMSKAVKLTLIFSTFIGAHAAGLMTGEGKPVLSEGLHALGTMLMGSAIFLVGQIYHLDSHYPDAFLLWALGALALAWARPSLTQAFMALILVMSWHMMEALNFQFANHWAFPLLLIGLFPLLFRLNSPVLARFTSAGMLLSLGLSTLELDEKLVVTTLLLCSAILLFLNNLAETEAKPLQQKVASEMSKPAAMVFTLILFLFTFHDALNELLLLRLDNTLPSLYFFGSLVLSQLVFVVLLLKRQLTPFSWVIEWALIMALIPMGINALPNSITGQSLPWLGYSPRLLPIAFNLMLLVFSIALMVKGARHADRWRMVYGALIFTALAMARYTDLFESLIARALVFVIVGIALFVLANVYHRKKKAAEGSA